MALTKISTDGVKDDAITKTKIPADQIETSEIASGAVTSTQIADNTIVDGDIADATITLAKLEHGTGSNDGKFLRANNGADPTFETVDTTPSFGSQNISTTGTLNCGQITTTANIELSSSDPVIAFTDTDDNDDFSIRGGGGLLRVRSDTDAADRLVIDSSGNVGIGTTSPSQKLHLKDTAPMAQIESSSYSSFVGTAESDNNIGNGTKAGNLVLRGQTGISISGNGGTATQVKIDADGIKFGTDTAAANALDDYEEGDWSPNVQQGGVGISSNSSRYVKIGNVCTVSCSFVPSGSGSASASVIFGNLPFQSHSSHAGSASIMHDGFDESGSPEPTVHAYIGGSTTNFLIYYSRVNGSGWQTARGNEVAGHQMIFNITYPTA